MLAVRFRSTKLWTPAHCNDASQRVVLPPSYQPVARILVAWLENLTAPFRKGIKDVKVNSLVYLFCICTVHILMAIGRGGLGIVSCGQTAFSPARRLSYGCVLYIVCYMPPARKNGHADCWEVKVLILKSNQSILSIRDDKRLLRKRVWFGSHRQFVVNTYRQL